MNGRREDEDEVETWIELEDRSVAEGRFLCDRSWRLGWVLEDASQGGPVWVTEQGIG